VFTTSAARVPTMAPWKPNPPPMRVPDLGTGTAQLEVVQIIPRYSVRRASQVPIGEYDSFLTQFQYDLGSWRRPPSVSPNRGPAVVDISVGSVPGDRVLYLGSSCRFAPFFVISRTHDGSRELEGTAPPVRAGGLVQTDSVTGHRRGCLSS
jgi:hypothetical protein